MNKKINQAKGVLASLGKIARPWLTGYLSGLRIKNETVERLTFSKVK
ncbi:MAG: hypothetical protein AB4062_08545 [Crocosphaera sp.]